MHELGHTLGLTHGGFYFDKLPPTAPNPPDYNTYPGSQLQAEPPECDELLCFKSTF